MDDAASFLSQDMYELQFAVKELARRMQQPNTKNMQALKRLVRFLKGSPRCLVVCNRQAEQPIVDVFSDSDWAGCAKTRRSTSSSYVMLGGHVLAASATTQNVVATSSGEAEFYALNKSASRAPVAVAMAADTAKVVKPRERVDATASKAFASRRGVGRVRHLHTQVLWVQEAVARRELAVAKVPGVENPADMGTKHLAQREMHEFLKREQDAISPEDGRGWRFGSHRGLGSSDPVAAVTDQEHRDGLTTGRVRREGLL